MTTASGPRSPDARTFSVEELLRKVLAGELRMPRFQRPLLWKSDDVLKLIDSIENGFPIGTLLFWERQAPAGTTRWGDWLQSVTANPRAWHIIDGQHRIASLVLCLLAPEGATWGSDHRFAWYWDVRTARLCRTSRQTHDAPAHWLPLHCVGDMVRLLEWCDRFRDAGGVADEIRRARTWARTILDYKLLAYVVAADSEETVRKIYDRTNTTGKRLLADDIFKGLLGHITGSDDAVGDIARTADIAGFRDLDRQWVIKAILAIEDLNLTQMDASVQNLSARGLKVSPQAVAVALVHAMTFLQRDCLVPSTRCVPYDLPVAVLANFFHRHANPQARSRILLRRWYWRGWLHASFAAGDRTRVRRMAAAIDADEEQSVQRLLALVPRADSTPDIAGRFALKDARSQLLVLAMAQWDPVDLRTGEPLDIAEVIYEAMDGAGLPKVAPSVGGALGNSAANRLLHPWVKPSDLEVVIATAPAKWLESHGLVDDPVPGEGTLLAREDLLLATATRMAHAMAEWDQSDRPSVAALIQCDTDDVAEETP